MNRLSSRQRKLVYFGLIVVLLIPVIWLGQPATQREGSGGKLAQLRRQHRLGEATLGEIDPSSATMNLVLLGLRGVAADLLWNKAIEQKQTKDWAGLKATVNSITLLQPHYIRVWDFQGWNLAYNVSAEWDAVEDRYYWVKEGAKFLGEGIERNEDVPDLYYHKARIVGQKIGLADEWRFYRRFFRHDPNPKYKNGPDPELDPLGKDNYLVAKDLHTLANEKDQLPGQDQHIEASYLFRSRPAHSQLEYAMALQREGIFEERSRQAWEVGYRNWTVDYGQQTFSTSVGQIPMDPSEEELARLARERDVPVEKLRRAVTGLQNIVNYRYWKRRADAERRGETEEAHRELYQAQQAFFKEADIAKARRLLKSGMKKYQYVFDNYFEGIRDDSFAIEEALKAVLLLQYIHKVLGEPMPDDFPLKQIWLENQDRVPEIDARLRRQRGSEG